MKINYYRDVDYTYTLFLVDNKQTIYLLLFLLLHLSLCQGLSCKSIQQIVNIVNLRKSVLVVLGRNVAVGSVYIIIIHLD
jgi:hypothetical protein